MLAHGGEAVEDETHGARDDALALAAGLHRARGRRRAHAVRLAAARLPVGKDLRARRAPDQGPVSVQLSAANSMPLYSQPHSEVCMP